MTLKYSYVFQCWVQKQTNTHTQTYTRIVHRHAGKHPLVSTPTHFWYVVQVIMHMQKYTLYFQCLSSSMRHKHTQILAHIRRWYYTPKCNTYSCFQFHTSSTNFSLPKSCLLSCFLCHKDFSTTTCVAIPAWSQPGIHRVGSPLILCLKKRRNVSISHWRNVSIFKLAILSIFAKL